MAHQGHVVLDDLSEVRVRELVVVRSFLAVDGGMLCLRRRLGLRAAPAPRVRHSSSIELQVPRRGGFEPRSEVRSRPKRVQYWAQAQNAACDASCLAAASPRIRDA